MDLMSTGRTNFESGSLWKDTTFKKYVLHTISTDPTSKKTYTYDFWLHFTIQWHCAGVINVMLKPGWWFSVSYFGGKYKDIFCNF